MHYTKIIAHRGASHESPENTLASIQKAIDIQADCIEIDVHLSKDHVPVVIHDDTVERTTSSKKKQRITEMTLQEIKQLDAGSWYHSSFEGESIPSLKEVLSLDFKESSLMIEIKKSPYPAPLVAQKIIDVVDEIKFPNSLILGSFEPELLQAVYTINPLMDLIYIVEDETHINKFQGQRIAIDEKLLSPLLIKQLRNKNKEIWTFTIDTPQRAQELNIPGIAGIITNDPRLMRELHRPKKITVQQKT